MGQPEIKRVLQAGAPRGERPRWRAELDRDVRAPFGDLVTAACFPIPDLQRGDNPHDGALYVLEAPAPGLPPTPFQPGADRTFR